MSAIVSLSRGLCDLPIRNVAIRDGVDLSTDDFLSNVACWANTLALHSGSRFVVFHSDPFEFLSILYALWHLKRVACIAGDNLPSTIKRLANEVDGFVGEINDGIQLDLEVHNKQMNKIDFAKLDSTSIAVELYTSGSSGQPKAIAKTLSQLENEVVCLQQQWQAKPSAVILSTVSHQHLYGLTFRILRPFCAGQVICCSLCEYTEDIYRLALIHNPFVLVSSPTHISRLNTLVDWSSVKGACLNIFSAAAPLEKIDAIRMSELLEAPLWEIYGSSETGVIAWRRQSMVLNSEYWARLPSVEFIVTDDKPTHVRSSFTDNQEALVLNDELQLHNNGLFELKGRTDNIVKVEGKRVSLTGIENLLLKHTWVDQVKAILMVSSKRTEVAIVIKLNNIGEHQLMLLGRQRFVKSLRQYLRVDMEITVVPRRWRFVDSMPYNQQGKITLESLQAIVEQPALLKWPIIQAVSKNENSVTINCLIPEDLIYFDGHFDKIPVLPGVVQVHWAHKLATEYFDITTRFSHLEVIKFSRIIQANKNLDISLAFNEEKRKVAFSYSCGEVTHASGRICFASD